MTAMVRVPPPSRLADAAGQVVVQVEQGGGALLFLGQVEGLLRVFEKMWSGRRAVEVEEAEVEARVVLRPRRLGVEAVRGGQDRRRGEGELVGSARKTATRATSRVRAGARRWSEQGLEIGFGAEAAAELDEGLAVVVAMAVEDAVDPALEAALEGIEELAR
jgi:hypothetical protein